MVVVENTIMAAGNAHDGTLKSKTIDPVAQLSW